MPKSRMQLALHVHRKSGTDTFPHFAGERRFIPSSAMIDRNGGKIITKPLLYPRPVYHQNSEVRALAVDHIQWTSNAQNPNTFTRRYLQDQDFTRLHTPFGFGEDVQTSSLAMAAYEIEKGILLSQDAMQGFISMAAYGYPEIAVLPDSLQLKVADENLIPVEMAAGPHSGAFAPGEPIPVGMAMGGLLVPADFWDAIANRTLIVGSINWYVDNADFSQGIHWGTFVVDRSTRTVFYFDSSTRHVGRRLTAAVDAISSLLRPLGIDCRLTGLHLACGQQPDSISCGPLSVWLLYQCIRMHRGIHPTVMDDYNINITPTGNITNVEDIRAIGSLQSLRLPVWNEWANRAESVDRIACFLQHMALAELGHTSDTYIDLDGQTYNFRCQGMFTYQIAQPTASIDYHNWFKGYFNIEPLDVNWAPTGSRHDLVDTTFNEDMSLARTISPYDMGAWWFDAVPLPPVNTTQWVPRGWGDAADPPWGILNSARILLSVGLGVSDGHGLGVPGQPRWPATMNTLLGNLASGQAPSVVAVKAAKAAKALAKKKSREKKSKAKNSQDGATTGQPDPTATKGTGGKSQAQSKETSKRKRSRPGDTQDDGGQSTQPAPATRPTTTSSAPADTTGNKRRKVKPTSSSTEANGATGQSDPTATQGTGGETQARSDRKSKRKWSRPDDTQDDGGQSNQPAPTTRPTTTSSAPTGTTGNKRRKIKPTSGSTEANARANASSDPPVSQQQGTRPSETEEKRPVAQTLETQIAIGDDSSMRRARMTSMQTNFPVAVEAGTSGDLMSSARLFLLRLRHLGPGRRVRYIRQRPGDGAQDSSVVLCPAGLVGQGSWNLAFEYLHEELVESRRRPRGSTREERYAARLRRRGEEP